MGQFPEHIVEYWPGVQNDNLIPNKPLRDHYRKAATGDQNTPIPKLNDFTKKWLDITARQVTSRRVKRRYRWKAHFYWCESFVLCYYCPKHSS